MRNFNLVFMKGQNLIIVMIKPFNPLYYGSSLEREVFPVNTEKVFYWWSVEYKTVASSTQQYKGKM